MIRKGFYSVAIVKNTHIVSHRAVASAASSSRSRCHHHTQPFGRRLAFFSVSNDEGRTITLNVPTMFAGLRADSGTLLQEMVHQYLNERGEPAGHDSEGWRSEIMRLHELVTGKKIWAGASITKRQVASFA